VRFEAVFVPGPRRRTVSTRRALEDPCCSTNIRLNLAAGLDTQDQRVARERMCFDIQPGSGLALRSSDRPRMDVEQGAAGSIVLIAGVLRAADRTSAIASRIRKRAARIAPSRLDWPAPADPKTAIDDAEYDLAALHRRSATSRCGAKGSARYLVESNASLARFPSQPPAGVAPIAGRRGWNGGSRSAPIWHRHRLC